MGGGGACSIQCVKSCKIESTWTPCPEQALSLIPAKQERGAVLWRVEVDTPSPIQSALPQPWHNHLRRTEGYSQCNQFWGLRLRCLTEKLLAYDGEGFLQSSMLHACNCTTRKTHLKCRLYGETSLLSHRNRKVIWPGLRKDK